jgi:hypothetical protein
MQGRGSFAWLTSCCPSGCTSMHLMPARSLGHARHWGGRRSGPRENAVLWSRRQQAMLRRCGHGKAMDLKLLIVPICAVSGLGPCLALGWAAEICHKCRRCSWASRRPRYARHVRCQAEMEASDIGGYTPADYITFCDEPDLQCHHKAEVLVDAPADVCFALWSDWSRLVDFMDLIGQVRPLQKGGMPYLGHSMLP